MDPSQLPPPYRTPLPLVRTKEWRNAPRIVKAWAYPLSWLVIIAAALMIMLILLAVASDYDSRSGDGAADLIAGSVVIGTLAAAALAVNIWLNRALKQGTPAAWIVQLILSILGLLGFPLGTLIHGYILSKWFEPETKAWFDRGG